MSSYLVYERKTQMYLAVESVRVVESMTVVESVRVVESMRARQINGGDIPETIYLFLRIVFPSGCIACLVIPRAYAVLSLNCSKNSHFSTSIALNFVAIFVSNSPMAEI